MKRIVKLIKDDDSVFVLDSDNYKLNMSDNVALSRYEKTNNIKLDEMIIDYISFIDENSEGKKGFKNIMKDIKEMVEANNIDYFVMGYPAGESKDTVCVTFNINNRFSTIDCELRVFYSNRRLGDEISVSISFGRGATSHYGYTFYKHFNYNYYMYFLKPILNKYFKSNENKEIEKEIIQYFVSDITSQIDYYYSE